MITSGLGLSMSWTIFSASAILERVPRITIALIEFTVNIRRMSVIPRIAVDTSERSCGVERFVR